MNRLKGRKKAAERIGDEVLLRRQHRSFVPNETLARGVLYSPHSFVILSSHSHDFVGSGRGKGPHHHCLFVMKKDGSMRPARDIYEWLQQYCVEQCAVLLALAEQIPTFTEPLPCQLGRADGYAAPQLCMGCASWWTDHGWNDNVSHKDEPKLFNKLLRDWRRTERPAAIVLAQVHAQGALLFELIQPFLVLPPMATHFPCTRAKLGAFLEEISEGEYPSEYKKKNSDSTEVFTERDSEDGLLGGYFLANEPVEFDTEKYW